jgi:hypothetical protein
LLTIDQVDYIQTKLREAKSMMNWRASSQAAAMETKFFSLLIDAEMLGSHLVGLVPLEAHTVERLNERLEPYLADD